MSKSPVNVKAQSFWEAATDPNDIVNKNTGNVGIGTATPQTILDAIKEQTTPRVWSGGVADCAIFERDNGTTGTSQVVIASSDAGISGVVFASRAEKSRGRVLYNHSDDSMRFDVNGATERMRIDSAGNVGIGTDAPDSLLHMLGDGFTRLKVESAGGFNSRLEIINGDDAGLGEIYFGDQSSNNRGRVTYDHSVDSMAFRTNNTERMRIDSSGNVGIGTDTPDGDLDVNGYIRSTAIGTIPTTGPAGIEMFYNTNQNRGLLNGYDRGAATYTPLGMYGENILFATGAPNASERMRIDSAGYVGIGTLIPTNLLHVSSDVSGEGIEVEVREGRPDIRLYRNEAAGTPAANASARLEWYANTAEGSKVLQARIDSRPLVTLTDADNSSEMRFLVSNGIGGTTEIASVNTNDGMKGTVANFAGPNAESRMVTLTQAEYDGITPDANTIYFVTE